MDEFDQSVMIALLPTTSEWCRIELPHCTLVYCGEIPDLSVTDHNELAKTTLSLAMLCSGPITLEVVGSDVFGEDEKVDVFLLGPTAELLAMRAIVEPWNASEHVVYRPHVTVGPEGSITGYVPPSLTFNRLLIAWGNDKISYRLGE